MSSNFHTITDAKGRPLIFSMTSGQISDYIEATVRLNDSLHAQWLWAITSTGSETLAKKKEGEIKSAFRTENSIIEPSNKTSATKNGSTV